MTGCTASKYDIYGQVCSTTPSTRAGVFRHKSIKYGGGTPPNPLSGSLGQGAQGKYAARFAQPRNDKRAQQLLLSE